MTTKPINHLKPPPVSDRNGWPPLALAGVAYEWIARPLPGVGSARGRQGARHATLWKRQSVCLKSSQLAHTLS
ncbi:MAG: hypothetical protein R2795_22525, partial [Saprospiraceae bacterium]